MNVVRLNEIYPHALDDIPYGFFTYLESWALLNGVDIPWLFETEEGTVTVDNSAALDYFYHGNHSGLKIVSPMVFNITQGQEITADKAKMFASHWYTLYGENLSRQFAIMKTEYNPIQNYNMTETGSDSKSGTDTINNSGNLTTTKSGIEKTENKLFGFDSSTAVGDGESKLTYGGSGSDARKDDVADTRQFQTTYASGVSHGLTRSGNIGVTTTQQMLQSEIELWKWNFYNDYVFPTVDVALTLPIY